MYRCSLFRHAKCQTRLCLNFASSISRATFAAGHRRFYPRQEIGERVVTEPPRYDITDPAPTETVVTVPHVARPTARYRYHWERTME